MYDRLAWSLASDGEYVTEDGAPTAFRPVGYPAFLAAIYVVFGRSWLAGGMANALLGTVTVGLTYLLARTVLTARLSLVAALLIALLPSHIFAIRRYSEWKLCIRCSYWVPWSQRIWPFERRVCETRYCWASALALVCMCAQFF